jgi:isopentenyl diphosphate isomerase/L-lactate dehydrogenase-like FMN-dependent dehydrogenase
MNRLSRAYNMDDLAAMARRRLPPGLYDYIDRGAEDEVTLRENSNSIKEALIRQRVGIDVSKRDFSTTLFGVKLSMPLGIAVTGLASLLAYDGERSLARAAAKAGVPFTIGTSNSTSITDLKAICGDLLWRQIYPPKRRDILNYHVAAAKEAGIRVLLVTMDSPVTGNREYLRRSGFTPGAMSFGAWLQILAAPHWCFGTLLRYLAEGGLPQMVNMPKGETRFINGPWSQIADDFTWDDVRALRRQWSDVLVLKGLSTAEDAKIAAACGADGIIVSNHGGRSLDGCVPSFGALPEIIDAVAPKVTVIVDGGFRRGADILKAIAMGASGVMVGRATLFGLAAGGEAGVARALEIFREEIGRALALIGATRLSDLTREHLMLRQPR